MPSNPPLVADLANEVSQRCGLMLDEVNIYLGGDLSAPIQQGLRVGCKKVMLTLANHLVLQDSDVANLSTFAVERVETEAELFALQWAMKNWYRAVRNHQAAVSSDVVASGWLRELKMGIRDHISSLKAICDEPYREPSDLVVVANRFGQTEPTVAPGQLPVQVTPGLGAGHPIDRLIGGDYGYGDGFHGGLGL